MWKGIEDSQLMGGFNYWSSIKSSHIDYDPSTGRVNTTMICLISRRWWTNHRKWALEFGIASMDQVIASYENDKDVSIGIISEAIEDITGGRLGFQVNQDQTTITNSEDIKLFYENTLQLPNTLEISALKQYQVLTADTTELRDEDGLGSFNYQWYSNGEAIEGATGEQFTLSQEQVGKEITVEVNYVDLHGTAEKMTSTAAPK